MSELWSVYKCLTQLDRNPSLPSYLILLFPFFPPLLLAQGTFYECVTKTVYKVIRSTWYCRWDHGSVWSHSPIIPVQTLCLFKWPCNAFSQVSVQSYQSIVCSLEPSYHAFKLWTCSPIHIHRLMENIKITPSEVYFVQVEPLYHWIMRNLHIPRGYKTIGCLPLADSVQTDKKSTMKEISILNDSSLMKKYTQCSTE